MKSSRRWNCRTSIFPRRNSFIGERMKPQHYRWNDVPSESVAQAVVRRYVTGDRVTVARFELAAGGVVPRHAHENEQVSCILSGVLRFRFDGQEVVARAGEVVRIPGGVDHAVDVVEDAV